MTRSPVVTLYPHRPAEVGVPSENPNLAERGLIITDFVDRVGDPVAIIAGDGSSHRAEGVLADALGSLLNALTGGRMPAEPIGVTHPAHWRPQAVEALRGALAAQPGLRGKEPALLTSDAVAALTALQDDPGVPTRGVIALCDVGGTGASITLADAANGFQPIGPTIRYPDFSGDLIDQALLSHVVGDLAGSGSVDLSSTSAIGNLSRLRGQCRAAKERLSTSAVTSLAVDLPSHRTDVRLTRTELDDAIRGPLGGFIDVLSDTLQRSGIRSSDLVAAAAVGGGARIPFLVTALSEHLRVPVITSAQPELAPAIGVGMKAARSAVPDGATAMAPAAAAPVAVPHDTAAPQSSTFRALAWSDADDLPEPVPQAPVEADDHLDPHQAYDPRPQLAFTESEEEAGTAAAEVPWYRRPVGILVIGVIAALAAVGGATWYVLRSDESSTPASTSTPTTATTAPPASSDAPQSNTEAPPPATQAPDQTVYQQAPPPPVVTVTEAPPPVTETPPPVTETPPPSSTTTTTAPPPTVTVTETPTPTPTTQQQVIPTLPYQTIPGLPFVPAPIQPPSQ